MNNIIKIKKINKNLNIYYLYLSLLRHYPKMMLLESTKKDAGELGRYSILGVHPFLTLKKELNTYFVNNSPLKTEKSEKTFSVFRKVFSEYSLKISNIHEALHQLNLTGEDFPFLGGAIGYFSYNLGCALEHITCHVPTNTFNCPDLYFNFYDVCFVVDHLRAESYFIAVSTTEQSFHIAEQVWQHYVNHFDLAYDPAAHVHVTPSMQESTPDFQTTMPPDIYRARFTQLKQAIQDGEVYIANLTRQFVCHTTRTKEEIYSQLRQNNPAPFAGLLNCDEFAILSSSPERFLKLQQQTVETCPIKGTRPRGKTPEADQAYRQALFQSEKDRAELLMIVDLERNDLSKVCALHSVHVPELFRIEQYQTVQHLVSTITGTLRPECDVFDLLAATFPGGSITGAPKRRAMQLLNDLETEPRGPYTGALGYISFHGNMDLNILIRSILLQGQQATFGVGGGITWDSECDAELQETLDKAYALMDSLN